MSRFKRSVQSLDFFPFMTHCFRFAAELRLAEAKEAMDQRLPNDRIPGRGMVGSD